MTVRRWFRDTAAQQAYEETIAAFADWLVNDEAASVVFVPQVTFSAAGDDDRIVARAIRARMKARGNVQLIEEELTPSRIRSLCGRMTAFVGTRMHSNIYALSMCVPTLAVSYQPKTAGIMAQLGLADFVVPIEDMDFRRLRATFELLIDRQDQIRDSLRKRLPDIRQAAERNSLLIEEDYTRIANRHLL